MLAGGHGHEIPREELGGGWGYLEWRDMVVKGSEAAIFRP